MKDTSKTIFEKGKGLRDMEMGTRIRVNSRMGKLRGRECILGVTRKYMTVNGRTV